MAATGSIKLTGDITGTLFGDLKVGGAAGTSLVTNTGGAELAAGAVVALSLALGDNTITVPVGAVAAIVVCDPTSTQVKKLKGVGGDTGITISKVGWAVIPFDSPAPANFVINSAAADTGKTTKVIFI